MMALAANETDGQRVPAPVGVPPLLLTTTFVEKGGAILLGRKKRGFGVGRYFGFGGKVEPGESILQAALRELREEACIEAVRYEKCAVVTFRFDTMAQPWEMHAYRVLEYAGEPAETAEMAPAWFDRSALPYGEMWEDAALWIPTVLEGKNICAHFSFRGLHDITDYSIQPMEGARVSK